MCLLESITFISNLIIFARISCFLFPFWEHWNSVFLTFCGTCFKPNVNVCLLNVDVKAKRTSPCNLKFNLDVNMSCQGMSNYAFSYI